MTDREKIIHAFETCTRDDFPCKECGYYIEGKDYDCIDTMMKDALDLLREQEPLMHAAWLFGETITAYDECGVKTWAVKYKCSKCGFVQIAIEAHMGQYSYCPSCGAMMDKGIKEGKVE